MFSIFYFKILIFWQQFPFIWLNMNLDKCFNFMMDFSWCFYLGPILRYLATKIPRKFPIKMHGRNLCFFFFNILFQNTNFLSAVPIHLIKHAFSKMFQFHDGLKLMFLPRANFEIFGNKYPKEIPYQNAWAKSVEFFFLQYFISKYWFSDSSSH